MKNDKHNAAGLQIKLAQRLIPHIRTHEIQVREVINKAQDEVLYLQRAYGRDVIDISLIPYVYEEEYQARLEEFVAATLVAKFALVNSIHEDGDLKSFLTAGVHPLSAKIMLAHEVQPFFRGRTDTFANLQNGKLDRTYIELNGGEPQGDMLWEKSIGVVEKVLRLASKNKKLNLDIKAPISPVVERLIDEYERLRFISDNALPSRPNFGFFAFRDPVTRADVSSISNAEVRQSAEVVTKRYGYVAIPFDPFDIQDFKTINILGNEFFVPVVSGIPIHIILRRHGEAFENVELCWQVLQKKHPTIFFSFTGLWHEKYNPHGGKCLLMHNNLNSFLTDKKLCVILGNPELQRRFSIQNKIAAVLQNKEVRQDLGVPESFNVNKVLGYIAEIVPRARMLRKKEEGLYEGDVGKSGAFSKDEIEYLIKEGRKNNVIKLSSLCGHSGTDVIVGPHFQIDGIYSEVFKYLSDGERQDFVSVFLKYTKIPFLFPDTLEKVWSTSNEFMISGDTIFGSLDDVSLKKDRNYIREISFRKVMKIFFNAMPKEAMEHIRDIMWKGIVHFALTRKDCLVQQLAEPQYMPAYIIRKGQELSDKFSNLRYDVNPQSIGTKITFDIIRVTGASDTTNITSGNGGIAIAIPKSKAQELIDQLG